MATPKTPEQETYLTELREFVAKYDQGTLSLGEAFRGLCRFNWVNLEGEMYVKVEDVLDTLAEWKVE